MCTGEVDGSVTQRNNASGTDNRETGVSTSAFGTGFHPTCILGPRADGGDTGGRAVRGRETRLSGTVSINAPSRVPCRPSSPAGDSRKHFAWTVIVAATEENTTESLTVWVSGKKKKKFTSVRVEHEQLSYTYL